MASLKAVDWRRRFGCGHFGQYGGQGGGVRRRSGGIVALRTRASCKGNGCNTSIKYFELNTRTCEKGT